MPRQLLFISDQSAITFHSHPYLERERQLLFTLAEPTRPGAGRTKSNYPGRQNPGRPPMLEDEDYLGRQNPGQDRQAPRSIILWMLRELKVKSNQLLFTLMTNYFSLSQGPAITLRSNYFSLQSEK